MARTSLSTVAEIRIAVFDPWKFSFFKHGGPFITAFKQAAGQGHRAVFVTD
jgi:hypothetical protein